MSSTPRVISVSNSKGGVGKSVVSILLAVAIAKEKGKKVLIIDCDSQGSVTEMYNHEMSLHDSDPAIEVEELTPRKVQTFLKRFGGDYDYIFIDVPRMTDKKKEESDFSGREKEVFKIYTRLNTINQHKMRPIPVCVIPDLLK